MLNTMNVTSSMLNVIVVTNAMLPKYLCKKKIFIVRKYELNIVTNAKYTKT